MAPQYKGLPGTSGPTDIRLLSPDIDDTDTSYGVNPPLGSQTLQSSTIVLLFCGPPDSPQSAQILLASFGAFIRQYPRCNIVFDALIEYLGALTLWSILSLCPLLFSLLFVGGCQIPNEGMGTDIMLNQKFMGLGKVETIPMTIQVFSTVVVT